MKETIAQFLKIEKFPFQIKNGNGKEIYYEDQTGYWSKREYDSHSNEIYYENSNGVVNDDRPKPIVEMTLQEIADKLGVDVSRIRIKD